jgi:RNA polymerase sigma-70 factor (ECF subfamily)
MKQALSISNRAELSDPQLARRIAGGDNAAFEVLMRRHNRALFRTARAILRDDAEAEDAVQEGYLQAYRALSTFRGESKLSTWLVRIVANEALMRLRKRTRRSEIVPLHSSATVEDLNQISDTTMHQGPEVSAQRAEM